MPPEKGQAPDEERSGETVDLAQAYRDLAKGEQTATALEANLANLESKLDAMLAVLEEKASAEGESQQTSEKSK
ncbi:hypothetical protein NOR_04601 [Metarhizium rileyi]|uniref:Uncharacterized protein n=1 Tax=Metarhizium rileyi (strain RCEF 4871) TaxID=1649241 RepID=A0A167E371_METRR|nr:hypothetical protein NOR_04601 [Metarhizium rileyi RCEF 4871]TWU76882.1 hypothetical protein ED733_006527 [Metarhizium rileyi]